MMPMALQQSANSVRIWLEMRIVLPMRAELLEEGLDLDPRTGVQAAGRLVEDQHGRVVDQRLRQAQPLLHAPRQPVDEGVALAGQVQQFHDVVQDLPPPGAGKLIGHGEEVEELPDLHAVVDAEAVGHVAHAPPHGQRVLAHAMAVDDPLAAGGLQQRGQEADGRALARPVGTDEAEHLAGLDLQVQLIDGQKVVVALAEVNEFDHR